MTKDEELAEIAIKAVMLLLPAGSREVVARAVENNSNFCWHCGGETLPCHCSNDE
jgi:hypothetical protein